MTRDVSESPHILAEALGRSSIFYFDAESLEDLVVQYYPTDRHAEITVALKDNSMEEVQRIYNIFTQDIVPLYIEETALDIHFLTEDARAFSAARQHDAVNSYAMA